MDSRLCVSLTTWGMCEHSFQFDMHGTPLVGYIELNLILSDPVELAPLMLGAASD